MKGILMIRSQEVLLAALTALVGIPACGQSASSLSDSDAGSTTSGSDTGATVDGGANATVDGAPAASMDGTTAALDGTAMLDGATTTADGSVTLDGTTKDSPSDATSAGDGSTDPCGASNPAVVALPVIGSQTFTVTTYGAIGDGKTDNTTTLQAALNAATAAGGGTVVVPSGTFLSGPIQLGNGTDLELSSGAVLEMLPMASWPGTTPFITATGAHDIALTGSGTIEGQGQAWWNALTATPTLARPQEVSFSNSTRVQISGIRLQNPPEEHIWVKGDTDVTITGITIQTLAVAGQHIPNNTDGVDISATGVFFCNNSIACGDDNVVMEGTNIYVAYSQFGVGHGCTIGSITENGVSAVTVDHVTMTGTTSGIRMKSERGRGGLVNNLTYSNITMTDVTNPIFIASYYPDLPTDPTTDTAQAITATTPQWENITLKNVSVTGSANAGTLWGLPEAKISNVTFDNVTVSANTGMDIFHATGISFTGGSTITVTTAPPVITYDATVTGITTHAYP
jgi:polygalacturonase